MFVGAAGGTPRGIDRVDMGYASRILAEPGGRNIGLVPSLGRMGVLTAMEAGRLAATVERHWTENKAPGTDDKFIWLKRRLAGEKLPLPTRTGDTHPGRARNRAVLRYVRMLLHARRSPLRYASKAVPQGAVYVNTGQILLGWGWFFDWLDRRPDVKPVLMMHDLIPMLYPEYSGPILQRHHARGLQTAAKRAVAMIATSHASADEIRDGLAALGRHDMPIHVVPLPVSDSLLGPVTGSGPMSGEPYFVTVGNIDQRKNHLLLLQVWRDMIRRQGAPPPKLVIIGSRGLRTQGALDFLERCPGLSDVVIEVNDLASQAMREVIRGAHALLMPSFTEGFGLPVVEALALGTPVIASDIPAHREVGGPFSTYLDPLDGPGWREEILRRAAEDRTMLGQRRSELKDYRIQTWTSYFDNVLPFLHSL
jgi:glycosyltransferase involved in cell wall biosynthesis